MAGMVTVNGVRYRAEDAHRLGLIRQDKPETEPSKKARAPRNKAAKPANK